MSDDQASEFEIQAKRVGRQRLPREWRTEILEAAMREGGEVPPTGWWNPPSWLRAILNPRDTEDSRPPREARATPLEVTEPTDAQDEEAVLDAADDRGRWEGRIRKAERRAMWSMAACFVVSLFLIALLFRPRFEPRAAQSWNEADAARKLGLSDQEPADQTGDLPRGEFLERNKGLAAIPLTPPPGPGPPPPPPAGEDSLVGPGDDAGQVEEANGGFLIRDAAINDIFQMLAKRSGKQYLHNPKIAGSDFNVSGHLNGDDPLQQMEELAFMHGLTLHEKGSTVYALNDEQLNQLPAEKLHYRLHSVRPDDIEKVKALVQPMLSPTGIANYEPKTNSITIIDSGHNVDRARSLLTALDEPPGQAVAKEVRNAELQRDGDRGGRPSAAEALTFQQTSSKSATPRTAGEERTLPEEKLQTERPGEPLVFFTDDSPAQNPPGAVPATTSPSSLGQHADGSSWGNVAIAGGVFADKAATEGNISLDRLASLRGVPVPDASSNGGLSNDFTTGALPSREAYESANSDFFPSSGQDDSVGAGPRFDKNADNPGWGKTAETLAKSRMTRADGLSRERAPLSAAPNSAMKSMNRPERPLADAGQASAEGQAKARPVTIRRAPVVVHKPRETEVSNQVTEEVRYSIDTKDPVGDPTTTREIGVTLAVTPTLLPDGTIQMKMRPRSAQIAEEIIGQSGNRYPQISESMLESIARIPEGHSLVLGGFYGQVKPKDDRKVPLLGNVPAIGFFFKDKEAAKEPTSLLFVVTPTSINNQVVVETKILSVNSSAGERTGIDWSSSLGAAGVPLESIGSLNSLFGIENPGAEASGSLAASDGPIVLSPEQTTGVLRALARGGIVTQTSNPTLITEDNEQATISLIDRVPIITTTINETEVSNQVAEEDSVIKVKEWDLPLQAWKKIQAGQPPLDGKSNAQALLGGNGESELKTEPEQALREYGITFPEGAVVKYTASTGTFVAENTAENLERIDSLVQGTLKQIEREREALNELEKNAGDQPYSTFSLNVSDVSFKLAKAALARGEWPATDQVRVEEFVNAFDYGDPAPSQTEKVACSLEQAAHPFLQQRNLLRVSMKTAALGRSADTPLRLTVLLDNSGSMDRADREDSVKNAFQLLANQLNPQDQVTLIGFARTTRLLADRLPGNRVGELAKVVESTPSEGGTNIEQALELGIAKAKEQMLEGGQNRIILLTDGAANLGNAKPEDLAKLVENMRQQGIAFDACGVGADGLNDDILESLTRKGDGRYYFLDRPEDADESFARQIAGALRPAARNVKVQMKFNPNRVGRYKLYGFEKHRLKKEDFRNDSVDAAELAAKEAGNAIYQVELLPEGSGEIGTVSVRFQDTESDHMIEREWTIPYHAQVPRLEDSAASLRLASGAALLGEKLQGSQIGESVEMPRLGKLMNSLTNAFPSNERVKELVQMARQARELRGE